MAARKLLLSFNLKKLEITKKISASSMIQVSTQKIMVCHNATRMTLLNAHSLRFIHTEGVSTVEEKSLGVYFSVTLSSYFFLALEYINRQYLQCFGLEWDPASMSFIIAKSIYLNDFNQSINLSDCI